MSGTSIRASRFGTAFNLLFMVHSPISQTAFRWLDCRKIGDESYLHVDYSINCSDDIHKSFIPLAVLMIIVYSIGIPFMLGLYLFKNRSKFFPFTICFFYEVCLLYFLFVCLFDLWKITQEYTDIPLHNFIFIFSRNNVVFDFIFI